MIALLSPRLWLCLGIAVVLSLAGAFLYGAGKATVRNEFDAYKIAQSETRILADRAQRTEETRRQGAIDKEATDAQFKITALETDVRRAAGAADGLRSAAADAARRAGKGSCTATAGTGQPDSEAFDLLAQLLGRSGERTAELGAYADRLVIAGRACEASYLALQPAAR